jgi:hypothetical protein
MPSGERVFTKPGKHGPGDMIIYYHPPRVPYPSTFKALGTIFRLKCLVEDRRFLPNGLGREMPVQFYDEIAYPSIWVPSTDTAIVQKIYDDKYAQNTAGRGKWSM